jgi:arsenate reductase
MMCCSNADQACPTVLGADARFSLHYEDPKSADGTPREAQAYDERCAQIATEMLYLMSRVSERLAASDTQARSTDALEP